MCLQACEGGHEGMRGSLCTSLCMHLHVHTRAYVCHVGSRVFVWMFCVLPSWRVGWRGVPRFPGSAVLWLSASGSRALMHILVFLTAVLPAAVTQLKNLGPCDCSETVQRQTSRIRGHFAIPAH